MAHQNVSAVLFKDMTESEQLLAMIAEMRALAATVRSRKIERPVT
jgi:hypothetical protein